MNMAVAPLSFASAYRQLRPAEKAFVDGYISQIEREAARNGERISLALYRAIPARVVEASRGMLDVPLVRAAIAERINDIAAASELTVQRVLKELMAMGFSSMGHYMEIGEDGQPYFDLAKCTPEQLSAIKSIEVEESGGGTISRPSKRKFKFTLHDKPTSIKMLAEFMGMLQPDNPFWRADNARPDRQAALPAGTPVEALGDRYAMMING